MAEKEKAPTKVSQVYQLYQQLEAQGVNSKVIYQKIAEELHISARVARSYVWRAKNPEAFKALLEKYYAKRKARLAAEKKPKKAKKAKATKAGESNIVYDPTQDRQAAKAK